MSLREAAADVHGKHALVYSLGIEGRDLATWLIKHGASVVMSDTRGDAALAAARAEAPAGVDCVVTGQPLLDPDGFDLVAVSQSILRSSAAVQRAHALGIPVTSQARLFLQLCPGRVIGITGSSGKSTTTSLVAAMARAAGVPYVVGGNLGEALLGRLDEITPATTVVLEISHTQLQYTERSPGIAAITNVTPNHLDQFSWEEYVGLKRHILDYQGLEDMAVLNADDEVGASLAAATRGRVLWASLAGKRASEGAWLEDGWVVCANEGRERRVVRRDAIRLRGAHNVANVVMATASGAAAGFPDEAIAEAAASFRGVPHRLEIVGSAGGVAFVNDSIATTPERTMAGLRSFGEPIVLLIGGREKHLPLDEFAAMAARRCREVVCFGEAGPLFANPLRHAGSAVTLTDTLEAAVSRAVAAAKPGDVVLLSPAATSFDAYPHFEARGEAFRALVRALPGFREEVQP